MRVIDAIPGSKIFVGHQGDNEATVVRFNAQPFYDLYGDNGSFGLYILRYGETEGYPVGGPLVLAEGDKVLWTVTAADVAIAGDNECQLRYIVDEMVVMSLKWTYVVQESISVGETVPEPLEEWADRLLEVASNILPLPEDLVRVPTATSLDTVLVVDEDEIKQIDPTDLFSDSFRSTSWTENGIDYQVCRVGNVAELTAASGGLTSAFEDNVAFGNVPSDYRPRYMTVQTWDVSRGSRILIATDGKIISTTDLASGAYIRFTATYICQ